MAEEHSLPLELTGSIVWLAHLIERFANLRLSESDLPTDMSFARANLLLAVDAAEADETSARMIDIAMDLGVTARTLTTMVDALVRQELMERQPDPDDRRAYQLLLTARGRAMVPALQSELLQAARQVVSPLSATEQDALMRMFTRLVERG